jgi:hypothetical protein
MLAEWEDAIIKGKNSLANVLIVSLYESLGRPDAFAISCSRDGDDWIINSTERYNGSGSREKAIAYVDALASGASGPDITTKGP